MRVGGSLLEEGVKRRRESLEGCGMPDTAPKTDSRQISLEDIGMIRDLHATKDIDRCNDCKVG